MTLLTQEEIQLVQQKVGMIAQFCSDKDFLPLLQQYIEQTRTLVDGTQDPILLHQMSIADMMKAKKNLTYIRGVVALILTISRHHEEFLSGLDKHP